LKNEKRRAKGKAGGEAGKRDGGMNLEKEKERDWDESSDDGAGEGLREAFEKVDLAEGEEVENGNVSTPKANGDRGGIVLEPEIARPIAERPPLPGDGDGVAISANSTSESQVQASTKAIITPTTSSPSVGQSSIKTNPKPHPIQGGRKGPIGLANPPPIPEVAPRPSDSSAWRKVGVSPAGKDHGKPREEARSAEKPIEPRSEGKRRRGE
jgi:hypothetical protein